MSGSLSDVTNKEPLALNNGIDRPVVCEKLLPIEAVCPFCFPDANLIFHAGDLVLGLWDGYPVSPGHALLIPRRHVSSWFEVTPDERSELVAATDIARQAILSRHQPDGFNIGVNVGPGDPRLRDQRRYLLALAAQALTAVPDLVSGLRRRLRGSASTQVVP